MTGEFRRLLFPRDHPRLAGARGMDPYAYREHARTPGTFTGGLVAGWIPLYMNEFRGITENGVRRSNLYPLAPAPAADRAPVAEMVAAAEALCALLDEGTRSRLCYDVWAPEWQTWANPEFMQFDTGLRLDAQTESVRTAVVALLRASLSSDGFELVRTVMRINGFLGDLVDLPLILGEWSFNVALYGKPDDRAPWGWQLFGHHLALNCLVVEGRMQLSPVFLGAEPDEIDAGPWRGVRDIFAPRLDAGLSLMAALTDDQRQQATLYRQMIDPDMPPGRIHPGDERHLAGAFQDNRVIPFEGVPVADLSADARQCALDVALSFVDLFPDGPRRLRMREIEQHLDETWFAWIGGHQPGDVFYYRLQSPVLVAELDHHCGVFLDYDSPQPFHVHTVMRTPHGNDYGREWVRQWRPSDSG